VLQENNCEKNEGLKIFWRIVGNIIAAGILLALLIAIIVFFYVRRMRLQIRDP